MNWIVDYVDGWETTFGEMPLVSARRAMRLVREFADQPARVDFEILFHYILRLYAEDLNDALALARPAPKPGRCGRGGVSGSPRMRKPRFDRRGGACQHPGSDHRMFGGTRPGRTASTTHDTLKIQYDKLIPQVFARLELDQLLEHAILMLRG